MSASNDLWTIAGDNVNLRRGPGTAHEIKRQLKRDQRVIEHDREGDWHHVQVVGIDGLLGWVHRDLLAPDVREAAAVAEVGPKAAAPEPSSPDPSPKSPVAVRNAFKDKEAPKAEATTDAPNPEDVLEEMRGYVQRREKLPKDPAEPRVGHSGREIISPVPIRNPGDQSRLPTELVLASSPEVAGIDVEAMEHFRDSVSYLNSRAWSVAGIKLFSEIEPIGGGVVQVKTTEDWFEVPKIGQTSYLNTLV
ncbi:MAG: SH3 domain-containing protein, partial [Pseudomonadota bacterium]